MQVFFGSVTSFKDYTRNESQKKIIICQQQQYSYQNLWARILLLAYSFQSAMKCSACAHCHIVSLKPVNRRNLQRYRQLAKRHRGMKQHFCRNQPFLINFINWFVMNVRNVNLCPDQLL